MPFFDVDTPSCQEDKPRSKHLEPALSLLATCHMSRDLLDDGLWRKDFLGHTKTHGMVRYCNYIAERGATGPMAQIGESHLWQLATTELSYSKLEESRIREFSRSRQRNLL